MSVKIQPVEAGERVKTFKKLFCPDHGLKFKYKCQFKDCAEPFICNRDECLDGHYHEEGRITMSKFSAEQFQHKLEKMQSIINNSEKIFNSAKQVKFVVDGLKTSLVTIFTDLKVFNQNCDTLKEHLDSALTIDYLSRLDNVYALEGKLSIGIQALRGKLGKLAPAKQAQLQDPQQQNGNGCPANRLASFLELNIPLFKMQAAREIYSLANPLTTCQKFHDRLAGKKNLIFLFSNETVTIGSYFSLAYPSVAQRFKQDLQSFMFILTEEGKFAKFVANQQSQYHISVSQKILICQGNTPSYGDGIRTFQKNFDTLDYCLPSKSFKSDIPNCEKEYNGTIKVKLMQILELD